MVVKTDINQTLLQISKKYVTEELSNKLASVWDSISIVLGGSVAYGEGDEHSDIDMFIVSANEAIKTILPISAEYEGKNVGVEFGYTWTQLDSYLKSPPADAEFIFWSVQNTVILHDPSGKFQGIQNAINGYFPEAVWKKFILKRWSSVFYCSKNGVRKALKREEFITAQIWKGKLLQAMMELVFLLNRQYIPPVKWMHRKFVGLPLLSADVETHLRRIIEIVHINEMDVEGQAIWDFFNTYIKENNLLPTEMADRPWLYA